MNRPCGIHRLDLSRRRGFQTRPYRISWRFRVGAVHLRPETSASPSARARVEGSVEPLRSRAESPLRWIFHLLMCSPTRGDWPGPRGHIPPKAGHHEAGVLPSVRVGKNFGCSDLTRGTVPFIPTRLGEELNFLLVKENDSAKITVRITARQSRNQKRSPLPSPPPSRGRVRVGGMLFV